MNPLSDIGMSDDLWIKFNQKFVKSSCLDDEGKPLVCPNCTSGEPVSLHHVPAGVGRDGKIMWSQGMFSCFACSMRLVFNVIRRSKGLPVPYVQPIELVEPSDGERSEWSEATREYVEGLEEAYDSSHSPTERKV